MKCLMVCVVMGICMLSAVAREIADFHDGWLFAREDGRFSPVSIPHDWAIAGPFNPDTIGKTGKLPWQGAGTYRKSLTLAEKPKGRVFLEFDGVMARATVYVNGQPCGKGEYGYIGFRADATPYLMVGDNDIVVKCDTLLHKSRWYPGAGIYRDVRIVHTDDVYIESDELQIVTSDVLSGKASVRVTGSLASRMSDNATVVLKAVIKDAGGKLVSETDEKLTVDSYANAGFSMSIMVPNPKLWELEDGAYLYTLELEMMGKGVKDSVIRKVGFRDFRFDADKGFIINGKRVQLNGVDLHSDLGPLGMAFNKDAMRRQLAIMRDMGMNAFRTSHNPPAPQVLDLCDEMGIFVWDEAFDKWNATCGRGDEPLEEFVDRQLVALVKRDRNHPCVFAWSIGNEISPGEAVPPGQEDWAGVSFSQGTTKERCGRFRRTILRHDATRPVGIGSCFGKKVVNRGDYEPLDITGWNYRRMYEFERMANPGKPVLYTESASALSEYGFYADSLPTNKIDYARSTFQVDSYDYNAAGWSDIPDWEFYRMETDTYCGGEFVWTGIDYLGEPTPYSIRYDKKGAAYREDSRSSYFGICDLCVFPKDRFYLYRSHWNRKEFTLHIVPGHWNFAGKGDINVPVFVYTSSDEAELFLNGRSLGRRTKKRDLVPNKKDYYSVLPRYRLIWDSVPYEQGELKVVAYENGKIIGTEILRTAGAAERVMLTPERVYGTLCVVKVTVVDKDGNPVHDDNRRVSFFADGCEILAVGNSDPRGYDSFKDVGSHPLRYGRAGVYLKLKPGIAAKLTATAEGLAAATCSVVAE